MALDRQNVVLNFGQGLDTKTDPKQVVQGKLLTLENGIFTSVGRIKKRKGFDTISNTVRQTTGDTTLDNSTMCGAYLNELILCDSTSMYSYNESSDTWLKKGAIASINVSEYPSVRNSYSQVNQDSAYVNGIVVNAWEDSAGSVRFSITDNATEQNIVNDTEIKLNGNAVAGTRPRVAILGNYAVIFYGNTIENTLYMYAVNVLNSLADPIHKEVFPTGDISTDYYYDVTNVGDRVFIGYKHATLGVAISSLSFDLIASTSISASGASNTCTGAITVMSNGPDNDVVVAYGTATKVKYFSVTYGGKSGSVLLQGATDVSTISNVYSITGTVSPIAGTFSLYYTISDTTSKINYYVSKCVVTNNTPAAATVFVRSVGLATKTFIYNDINYMTVAYDTAMQPTYFVIDENGNIVAKILHQLGGGIPTSHSLSSVNSISSTIFQMSLLHKDFVYNSGMNIYFQTGVDVVLLNFYDSQKSYIHSELADNMHLSGGLLNMYDGITPVEHGFHIYPEEVVASYEVSCSATFTNGSADIVIVDSTSVMAVTGSIGTQVRFYTMGTMPVNFSDSVTYWVIYKSGTTIRLSATYNGSAITAGSAGVGAQTMYNVSIDPAATFTNGQKDIALASSKGFSVGQVVYLTGTVAPTNFTLSTSMTAPTTPYYVTAVSGNNIQISLDKGGAAIQCGVVTGTAVIAHVFTPKLLEGDYQYKVCYEWTDNKGQIHRSAPSIPDSDPTRGYHTLFSSPSVNRNAINLKVPTLRLTSKTGTRSPVRIVIYRTKANGTVFYQVTSPTAPVLNDYVASPVGYTWNADYVTFTDYLTDDDLNSRAPLYTTGEVVENISPPPCSSMTTYKNRLVLLSTENPLQLWYSKQVVQGSPVEFSDFFTLNIDSKGGDITAISNLDDKLVIFKRDSIFVITGTGPTDSGSQNDFSDAQLITTDAGCNNAKSVVITPSGIMFQSPKGIYLLDRSMMVNYVGAPVEKYNTDEVLAALLLSETQQVRFCLNTGIVLVYDYFVEQWATFTNINAIDACIFQNKMVYTRPTGVTLLENDTYTDEGKFIKLRVKTSWLSFAGLQGFQRVRRLMILGEYISPHYLKIGIASNFNTSALQQETIDTSTLACGNFGDDATFGSEDLFGLNNTIGEYPLYQWRVHVADQKSQSFQISLEDIQTSDYGEGYNISAITCEVAAKKGTWKPSAARSV